MQLILPPHAPVLSPEEFAVSRVRLPDLRKEMGEEQFISSMESLTDEEALALLHHWPSWARNEQLEPSGDWWIIWLYLAGRGSGKTRTGAEWVKMQVEQGAGRIAFVAQSASDARDVMVEGEAGILSVYPPQDRPKYEPSKRRVSWPSGAVATLYSAEDPDQLRGPSHDLAWVDELAAFKQAKDVWSNLMFGLRLGRSRCFISTTPRPTKLIKELVSRRDKDVAISVGKTYDNIDNLSQAFINEVIVPYEGTRIGRQELNAEILEDVEGALWNYVLIEQQRTKKAPELKKILVAVDPSVGGGEENTECGIMVGGIDSHENGYLLADVSMTASPAVWADQVIRAYNAWDANLVVAEKNNGGEMVELTISGASKSFVPVKLIWASKGKIARAEPVSGLTEKKKIFFVGSFPQLEDELTTYDGTGASPNRLDAFVWLFTELLVKKGSRRGVFGRKNRLRQRA